MSLRLRRFTANLVAALAAASAASCTSKTATVGQLASSAPGPIPPSVDPIDASERIVTAAIAQVRESAVALEYTAADAPTGTRRAALGRGGGLRRGIALGADRPAVGRRADRGESRFRPPVARAVGGVRSRRPA